MGGLDGRDREQAVVHDVERLDRVASVNDTRDANKGSVVLGADAETHLISDAPCEIISMLMLPSASVLSQSAEGERVEDRT